MLSIILSVLLIAVSGVISWLIVCGFVYLIALCFGLAFSWPIATGIWLIMFLIKSVIYRK